MHTNQHLSQSPYTAEYRYGNVIDSEITLKGISIKKVEKFKYLGTWITNNGKCEKEKNQEFAIAKETFYKLTNIFTNQHIKLNNKLNILNTQIYSKFYSKLVNV